MRRSALPPLLIALSLAGCSAPGPVEPPGVRDVHRPEPRGAAVPESGTASDSTAGGRGIMFGSGT